MFSPFVPKGLWCTRALDALSVSTFLHRISHGISHPVMSSNTPTPACGTCIEAYATSKNLVQFPVSIWFQKSLPSKADKVSDRFGCCRVAVLCRHWLMSLVVGCWLSIVFLVVPSLPFTHCRSLVIVIPSLSSFPRHHRFLIRLSRSSFLLVAFIVNSAGEHYGSHDVSRKLFTVRSCWRGTKPHLLYTPLESITMPSSCHDLNNQIH